MDATNVNNKVNLREENDKTSSRFKVIYDFAVATTACLNNKINPLETFEELSVFFPSKAKQIIYEHLEAYIFMKENNLLGKVFYPGVLTRINPLYYLLVNVESFEKIFYTTSDYMIYGRYGEDIHLAEYYNIEEIEREAQSKGYFNFGNNPAFSSAKASVSEKASFVVDSSKIAEDNETKLQKLIPVNFVKIGKLYGTLETRLSGIKYSYNEGQIIFLVTFEQNLNVNINKLEPRYGKTFEYRTEKLVFKLPEGYRSEGELKAFFEKNMLYGQSREKFFGQTENFRQSSLDDINISLAKLLIIYREISNIVEKSNFIQFEDARRN